MMNGPIKTVFLGCFRWSVHHHKRPAGALYKNQNNGLKVLIRQWQFAANEKPFLAFCISLVDATKDQYVEEMEPGAYESRTDESLLIQQKPVSRGKLEARTDSVRVQLCSFASASPTLSCAPFPLYSAADVLTVPGAWLIISALSSFCLLL